MSTLPYESKSLAKSIVADGSKNPNHPVSPKPARKATASSFHSITITPAENGVTVEHMPKDEKHGGGSYEKRTSHVFNSMGAAHGHVGKLMGCGSGE